MAAEIHWKDIKIRALTFELATLKRLKFGAKTEAFTAEQRDLFTETLETDLSAMQAELENLSSPPPRAKAKPPGRNPLPPELPRVEYRHEPESCSCGACGRDLVKIGEDISEQLDVEPARFFVNRHIRPQYACRTCETITAAAVPAAVIDGGLASPGLLACIAHVRRKFFDLHAADQHPVATEALHRIAEFYHIESEARDYSPEQRQRWREQLAVPRLDAMYTWMQLIRSHTIDGGALAKALDHGIKRWPIIRRYATSGTLPIDNNPAEHSIRPIAVGKRNWLFAGLERAGKRAAAIQTLLATAKANGIEPLAWLKDTLEKLPAWPNSRIDELLPLRS